MPSGSPAGWTVYSIVFLAGAVSCLVPLLLRAISSAISSKSPVALPPGPGDRPSRELARQKTNPRSFIAINAAAALLALTFLIFPCAISLAGNPGRGLISVISLGAFSFLALVYAIRRGDLDWIKSYRKDG